MTYDEAAAIWVARHFGIQAHQISDVEFVGEDGYALSEVTWEPGTLTVEFKADGSAQRKTVGDKWELTAVIRELVEIASEARVAR